MLPTIFYLPGFGGTAASTLNEDPFSQNIIQRVDRLISNNICKPFILIIIDCFTKFGGSQYINSSAIGNYEDYIIKEVVPFIEKQYNSKTHAIIGKSSGGYGSLMLSMKYPEIFSALAVHSGDSAFEYCYLPDFPKAIMSFQSSGGPLDWLDSFWKKPIRNLKQDFPALNILAMSAHYSPNTNNKNGFDLPFDLLTGKIIEKVWQKWLSYDPVRIIQDHKKSLQKMKFIYIDCGSKDEFNMQIGARILHSKLKEMIISHYYEEFEGGHMNTNHRFEVSLPKISNALNAA